MEGAPGGPQAGSLKRSMSCREATCACHKRQHVKTDLRKVLTSTLSANAQPGMARAGALPSSAHHIHVARPSYNTDDRRSKAPRQQLTWWFCGASSRSYGPPAGSGV